MTNAVVFISGPYMGNVRNYDHTNYFNIDRNINRAAEAAAGLAREGITFFCPHLHSAHFEVITPDVLPAFWYDLDLHFLRACNAILLLPGWQESKGCKVELEEANLQHFPVFYTVEEVVDWAHGIADAHLGRLVT
jgi:hypothetical protein